MASRNLNVLVLDDSAMVRKVLSALLAQEPEINVITAATGPIAFTKMKRVRPDVIVLDLEMPEMDGITFLRKVMVTDPIPVVICSDQASRGSEKALKALELGAVEIINKPKIGVEEFLYESAVLIIDRVKAASQAKVRPNLAFSTDSNHKRAMLPISPELKSSTIPARKRAMLPISPELKSSTIPARKRAMLPISPELKSSTIPARKRAMLPIAPKLKSSALPAHKKSIPQISHNLKTSPIRGNWREVVVCIGASTGGTEAIAMLLQAMPVDMPAIAIVQHMPAGFTAAFAGRLNTICPIEIIEARNGDFLYPGRALIAPGDKHMALRKSSRGIVVETIDGPLVSRHRPSCDILFKSAASLMGDKAVGVILTGMGSDGAEGILEMKLAGARTIAQDQASCIVYGMPKVAVELGAIDEVLGLRAIPSAILSLSGYSRIA